jgi:hypothetical protein
MTSRRSSEHEFAHPNGVYTPFNDGSYRLKQTVEFDKTPALEASSEEK